MDTSKQYILMCEKAKEIHKEYKGKESDFWAYRVKRKWIVGTLDEQGFHQGAVKKSITWLPRQDQLQKIVHPSDCTYDISFELLDKFIEWYQYITYNFKVNIYSMEQLWLSFVMRKKYNKVWSGSAWIIPNGI